jgi:hypothetical protein
MKICLLNDTSYGVWWGGQTTIMGLKELIYEKWPMCNIDSVELPDLKNWDEIEFNNQENVVKIIEGQSSKIGKYIKNFKKYDLLICNGEGSIHDLKPSVNGPCNIILAMLIFKQIINKPVFLVNCTISSGGRILELVKYLINDIDFISVREPYSHQFLKALGREDVVQSIDATFASQFSQWAHRQGEILCGERIGLCGTSVYGDSPKEAFMQIAKGVKRKYNDNKIVGFTPRKNHPDIALFNLIKKGNPDISVKKISSPKNVIKNLSSCKLVVTGRFHLNIFCSIVGLPFIPIVGNTYKNIGLNEILDYRMKPIDICNVSSEKIMEDLFLAFEFMDNNYSNLRKRLRLRFQDLRSLARFNLPR